MSNTYTTHRLLFVLPRLLLSAVLLCAGAAQAAGTTGQPINTGPTQCTSEDSMPACIAGGSDFTKICWNGDAQGSGTCTGALVANTRGASTGSTSTDWACTRDKVTNLIWSLESGVGDWTTYARSTLPNATNAASRCGYNSGWRLPTRRELLNIVRSGNGYPSIDTNYFPGTQVDIYWADTAYPQDPAEAWLVNFYNGSIAVGRTAYTNHVRLVRSGQ